MGELVGMFLGGWVWVAIGRAVASRFSWDRVMIAGFVAVAVLLGGLWLSASYGTHSDKIALYLGGHSLSIAFWLWRYAVSLRRAGTPAS